MTTDHGGSGRRYEDGCRCPVCTEAHRVRITRRRNERRAGRVLVDGRLVAWQAPEHGRRSTYSNWGCRCVLCALAWKR